jgi:N-acetylmuramic acid 6-phosphate etherase
MVDGREFHEDDAERAAADVRALSPTAADVVLGVSASGRTPYVLAGVAAARDAGAYTIGFACVAGSPLAAAADAAIEVTTGAEIISGSTRLNAGSAQKLVLNAISTIVMVRMGRTFGNLMVDVVPDNGKLRRRAMRALAQATGLDDEQAGAALDDAGGDTKAALVAVLAGISPDQAKRLLEETDGYARAAIARAEALAEDAD